MVTAGKPALLSVVIPSFNSASWLPSTLEALAQAITNADLAVEVVVVDDGSDDGSQELVASMAPGFPCHLEVVRQDNAGRFLARWAGLQRARGDFVFLLDSRVIVRPDALAYVSRAVRSSPAPAGWNAHVDTDPKFPLVGRFWEVPTFIFWRDYLSDPRPYQLDATTFDRAPKGTGAFVARRETLVEAFRMAWPEGDPKLISDDTKILRWIAEHGGIRLDPAFSAVYRPRTTVRGFVRHSYDRGTLFVDSYAGTSLLRSLVLLLASAAPIIGLVTLALLLAVGAFTAAIALAAVVVLLLLAPLVPAALNRCPPRALLSYFCYLPVFLLPFWAGLVRGVVIHRSAFMRRGSTATSSPGKAHQ